ncbi:MAG: 50S rRNA methyltransferase [Bdellovibrio sp.]|nr:MAG: 50S rRNA methyltransferase [Bdellovibrio sp.]
MKVVLLCLSSGGPPWLKEALGDFERKIRPLIPFETAQLSSKSFSRKNSRRKVAEEGRKAREAATSDDFVVLFDERGVALDSPAFAKKVNTVFLSGKKRALFIVGGPFGFDEELRRRADMILALAPFVLNHFVAQLVAAEQIYRSLTILKGLPYHNE